MLKDDLHMVSTAVRERGYRNEIDAMRRIKKYLDESCQQPITQGKTPATPTPGGEICSDNPCDYCQLGGTCSLRYPCHSQFKGRKLLLP